MIELNLVPDVKQELLRAQRQQAVVVSIAILVSIAAIGIVVVLGAYVLVQQGVVNRSLDKSIAELTEDIEGKEGLPNALTIQKQLASITSTYEQRTDSSRILDIMSVISPKSSSKNAISISQLSVDSEENLITIEAQAKNGYEALETFKKTIQATNITYRVDDETVTEPLAEAIMDGERSYGEDSEGQKVLRFTIAFEYPDDLFATTLTGLRIIGPKGEVNVTDSKINVPSSLFTERASDEEDD